jgi:hypothetical protein
MAVMLTGCAEVSFKRGGSAADFDADKSACQQAIAGTGESLAECMEGRGWFLHQFADDAADDVSETTESAGDPDAGVATGDVGTSAAGASTEPEAPVAKKKRSKAATRPAPIGTWFKLGAAPGALEADQAACVAELGEEHRIRSASQPVSPAMRACMKQRGWFGLESSPTR